MNPSRSLLSILAVAPLAFAALTPGCSSKSNPTPRVALFSQLGNSTDHPQEQCKLTYSDWVDVGSVGDNKVPGTSTVPVNDGDQDLGHNVHITACSVTPEGDGFLVNVSVTVEGQGGFTVNGHFNKTGTQPNIQAVFQRGDTGSFTENDCTADFQRDGTVAPEMGVEAGRIWAQVHCPNATFASQNRVCQGFAEFRFENCSQ